MARKIALLLWLLLLLPQAPVVHAQRKPAAGKSKKVTRPGRARPSARAHPPSATQVPAPVPAPAAVRPLEEVKPPAKAEDDRELKRGERVEFDGRLIEGQTAAAGAIYLFERLPSELRSMVLERQGYRREELETLYPNGTPPSERRPMGPPGPGAASGEKASGR